MQKSLLLALCLILTFSIASAQTFQVNGNAYQYGSSCYRLTDQVNNQSGSIWYLNLIDLSQSFAVKFDIFLGWFDSNGADGIYFGLQPISTAVGGSGGGIGFAGISPSIGVEFDTYENGGNADPWFDHVSIMRNGNLAHNNSNNLVGPVQISPTSTNVEDGAWHKVDIIWDANTYNFEVRFDCVTRATYNGDIVSNTFGGNPMVYLGFTAGTGSLNNIQDVF